jgi:signal transduction histidine kinase
MVDRSQRPPQRDKALAGAVGRAARPGDAGGPASIVFVNLVLQPLRRPLRSFGSRRTWLESADLVVNLVVGACFATATAAALLIVLATSWVLGVGVMCRAGALWLSGQMARFERWRLQRLGGVRVEPRRLPEPGPLASRRERQLAWGRASWLWSLPAYQLARLPLAAAAAFVAVGWAWGTVVCFVLAGQPKGPTLLLAWNVGPLALGAPGTVGLVVAGAAGALLWPALAGAAMALDAGLARRLLGPSRGSELAAQVSRLSDARSLAVESAEAERRRIERDLHDGLQPQLVSLALELGLARARNDQGSRAIGPMLERAHEEAKRAVEDLRNLVRGIHPSVLDERGVDAALSALVASCPVPVAVDVAVQRRLGPALEATAYFVVAEAVTNITKHAGAQRATVAISEQDGALKVVVTDDGRGGARLSPGGGLAGLAARVASIDGTFALSSPEGGPTRIEAVLPCEW